jgi:Transglutaminase-like superfamily
MRELNRRPRLWIAAGAPAVISRSSWSKRRRSLGFGARIVSGYLYRPDLNSIGSADAGSTHAWAEVFVPGAGWITFDPANNGVGGFNLIPVAVARDIRQTMPVIGSFVGTTDAFQAMAVEVLVTSQARRGALPSGAIATRLGSV